MHLGPAKLERYELRSVLASSATGVVYEGWDGRIARKVAIKTVSLSDPADAEISDKLERFRREAQAAGRLQHPNIVAVYDYGETDALAYIVMELIEGPTLKALFDDKKRFLTGEITSIMTDVLSALQYSHEHGVIHRDVKPGNIMFAPNGRAKLADFGIARIERSSMTSVGTVMGTPAYMSPEQFLGETVDRRTDIYSAGVVLYQMLTGERPYEGSVATIMYKVLNESPPIPSKSSAQVTAAFDGIVARAMAKKPEDRFADASAFAQHLQAATEPTFVLKRPRERQAATARVAPPAARPVRAQQPQARNLMAGSVAGVVIVAAIGAATFWYLGGFAPKLEPDALQTAEATHTPKPEPVVASAPVPAAPLPAAPVASAPAPVPVPVPVLPAQASSPPPPPPPGAAAGRADAGAVTGRVPAASGPKVAGSNAPHRPLPPLVPPALTAFAPLPAQRPPLPPPQPPPRAEHEEAAISLGVTRWWSDADHGGCARPMVSGSWPQHEASAELLILSRDHGCWVSVWANMSRRLPFRSLSVASPAEHGSVRISGSRFEYAPGKGFSGHDLFAIAGVPAGSMTVRVTVLPRQPDRVSSDRPARGEQPDGTASAPAAAPDAKSWIGAEFRPLSQARAEELGLGAPDGVLVGRLRPGSPAEKANLQPRDVILAFDSVLVHDPGDLSRLVRDTPVGTSVPVEIWHDRQFMKIEVVTAEAPK